MNDDYRQNGGAAAWTVIAIIVWLVVAGLFLALTGCTYTRNAPLLNVEANGNTVPVSAAP